MHCYCIFCDTNKCDTAAKMAESFYSVKAVSPMITKRHKIKGKLVDVERQLMPGYIFLFSEDPVESFDKLRRIDGFYRLLGRKEDGYELEGDDRHSALRIYGTNGLIPPQKIYKEGDRVTLGPELFAGMQGTIRKYEKNNKRILVEFKFENTSRLVWVAADLIEQRT